MSFTIIEKLTSVLLRSPLTKEVTHKTQNSVSRNRKKPQKTKTYVKKIFLEKNSVRHSAEELPLLFPLNLRASNFLV